MCLDIGSTDLYRLIASTSLISSVIVCLLCIIDIQMKNCHQPGDDWDFEDFLDEKSLQAIDNLATNASTSCDTSVDNTKGSIHRTVW